LGDSDVSTLSGAKYAKMFPALVVSKRGSPENGGGTWLHPDLAVQLAQWCSPAFAIQVSRWIQDWIIKSQNPVASQADLDRIRYRSNLKDEARLRMTNQVDYKEAKTLQAWIQSACDQCKPTRRVRKIYHYDRDTAVPRLFVSA
jgi:KilA-N domain